MPRLIDEALAWHAGHSPDKLALVSASGRLTYAQLWRRATRLADGLRRHGLQPGDRIALMLSNGAPYIELYHAAAILGAAVVPLNFRFVASEADYIVKHSGARALVFEDSLREAVASARSGPGAADLLAVVVGDVRDAGEVGYEALLATGADAPLPFSPDPQACYFQGYTSGTTGFPKGCVNPHDRFAECLDRMSRVYDVTPGDIQLMAAPLFHEAPALFALTQLYAGGTLVLTADSSPANVFELIAREQVSWTFMVPTMWAAMAASPLIEAAELSSLRAIVSGGSPLQTPTKLALMAHLPNAGLHEFYGATEVGLITNLRPEDQQRKTRCVGKPVPGMLVELRDDDGAVVPQGEIGEIHIGGATLIREYYRNPEATAMARSERGFFTLGDMGRFDDEGYLYIVDRKKDMIISGGENIFPNDIEDALYQHPSVQMAAVVGAPHELWGEVVVAVVVLRPGQSTSEAELLAHCKKNLSSFKVPKHIDFRPTLPLSSFGKILRREVRQDYWTQQEVQV
jgi:acyl-CoA synthetase (AMP-forming)/AMP-acid ligase II